MIRKPTSIWPTVLLCTLWLAGSASAMYISRPTAPVPVERLVENLTKQISADGKEPKPYYSIGRIYSLAYAFGRNALDSYEPDAQGHGPIVQDFYEGVRLHVSEKQEIEQEDRLRYLTESIRYYELSDAQDKSAYNALALGWSCQEAAKYPGKIPFAVPLDPASAEAFARLWNQLTSNDAARRDAAQKTLAEKALEFAPEAQKRLATATDSEKEMLLSLLVRAWENKALNAYSRDYEAVRDKSFEGKIFDNVVFEIATGTEEILKSRPQPSYSEKRQLKRVRKDLETMKGFSRIVTPIIFSLDENCSISELINPDAKVRFDFTALGSHDVWPWVKPSTAILVWDPLKTGQIKNGTQLIGSVTWWILWSDGFAVLSALDDDSDGWLTGKELVGLAVWRDVNGNAMSDPGEVASIESTPVRAIATSYTGHGTDCLTNPAGIITSNGRSLPLYDWSPRSVSDTISRP